MCFFAGSTHGERSSSTSSTTPELKSTIRGLSNSFGVFQTYYEQKLPQSPSEISWIGSLQALLLMGVGILVGPAYDAGFFTELVLAGTVLVPFGFMMTSLAYKYWEILLAQGSSRSTGRSLMTNISMRRGSCWYRHGLPLYSVSVRLTTMVHEETCPCERVGRQWC